MIFAMYLFDEVWQKLLLIQTCLGGGAREHIINPLTRSLRFNQLEKEEF